MFLKPFAVHFPQNRGVDRRLHYKLDFVSEKREPHILTVGEETQIPIRELRNSAEEIIHLPKNSAIISSRKAVDLRDTSTMASW